jgi:hypothetical protein
MWTLLAVVLNMLVLVGHVRAEPLPVPKTGQCPAGYRESGGYCALTSDRAPAAVMMDMQDDWLRGLRHPVQRFQSLGNLVLANDTPVTRW